MEKSVDLVYIKDQLGYSSLKMTADVYDLGSKEERSRWIFWMDFCKHLHPGNNKGAAKTG